MITSELLLVLLDEKRNEEDRFESLHKLRDYLDQEDVITTLATLAKTEKSAAIRKKLLSIIVEAEITNLKNKDKFLKIIFHFSSIEREEELRLIAINKLSELAFQDKRIELLLAENLLYDTSQAIQRACLLGLQKAGCRDKITINKLSLYAQKTTNATINEFLTLLRKLTIEQSEPILVNLLNPLNNADTKATTIQELTRFSSLQTTTIQRTLDILLEDHNHPNLEKSILVLLNSRAMQDLSIVDTIIENLKINPQNRTKLLWLLQELIVASLDAVDKVKALYRSTKSILLKTSILETLNETDALDIEIESLTNPNPQVRQKGLYYCIKNIEKGKQRITQAMLGAIQKEPDINLRTLLANEISKVDYLDEHSQKMILIYYNKEDNPWVLGKLTKILFLIPLRNDNKEMVLKAYIKTLREVFFADELKDYVINQLNSFLLSNYSNAHTPELVQCLISLMLQEFDLGRIKKIYNQYNKLERKDDEHIKLLLLLFERFAHFYPNEPLTIWANELKFKIAENKLVREKAEFLAKITGDNIFLVKKGALDTSSSLVENIITSIKERQQGTANTMLQDAYRNRKIKKEEIILLYKKLLQSFDNTGLIYKVLDILREQHLITPEIVEFSLDFITSYPDMSLAYDVRSMLSSMGKNMPEYAQYLENEMTPQNYKSYTLKTYQIHTNFDLNWRNSWKTVYNNWALGQLWSELYPEISLLKFFNTQSDIESLDKQDLDYYILRKISGIMIKKEEIVGEQTISGEEILLNIGNRIDQLEPNNVSGSFYDRILYVFTSKWQRFISLKEQPSKALSQCATKVHYQMYKRWKAYPDRVSYELLEMPLWLDFNLLSELLKKDSATFEEFFNPYYNLLKTEAKNKVQNNHFPNREQPVQYRIPPQFNIISLNNYVINITKFIITANWTEGKETILKESLSLIRKVWKGANGDLVMTQLGYIAESKRNEMLRIL